MQYLYTTKSNSELKHQLNGPLYKACIEYGYHFLDDGAVWKGNLLTDGIRILESNKMAIAECLIRSFDYFSELMIPNSRNC